MKILLSAVVLVASFAGSTFAKDLTFEEFKESCRNPEAYGHQNPPSKIKLLCNDVYTGWEPVESGIVKLSESRMISSELRSDKHSVSVASFDVSVPERNANCPRFREVVQRTSVEITRSCADLDNDLTLKDICRGVLDDTITENPDAVETEASGRMFSVCGDSTQKP